MTIKKTCQCREKAIFRDIDQMKLSIHTGEYQHLQKIAQRIQQKTRRFQEKHAAGDAGGSTSF